MANNVHANATSTAVLTPGLAPVIGPGHDFETVTEAVSQIPLAKRTPLGWVFGFLIGLFDQERLRRTVIGGAVGGFSGMTVGTVVGQWIWAPPEGRWAGAVIGSAAGLLAGSLVGVVWPAPEEEQGAQAAQARIPIVTFRF